VSLAVEYVGCAEGVASDSRGALTIVGFHPHVFALETLPGPLAPTFILILEDNEDPAPVLVAGQSVVVRLEVHDPDGQTLFLTEMAQPIQARPPVPAPPRMQVIAQIPLMIPKAGEYRFVATVTLIDAGVSPTVASYVVRVVDAEALRSAMRSAAEAGLRT